MSNIETSLTAPEDRKFTQTKNPEDKWFPTPTTPKLSNEQTAIATANLNVPCFPNIERGFCDPQIVNQKIGLFSFFPAKGATPNEKGIFGYGKIRGTFNSEFEANAKATEIIKKFDSVHKIFHIYVGHPFPVTTLSDFSKKIDEVRIDSEEINEELNNFQKNQKEKEEEEMENIKKRQEKLQESPNEKIEPITIYTTEKVKLANLKWTLDKYKQNIIEIENNIFKAQDKIFEMNKKFPEFKNQYMENYKKSCKEVGISDENMSDDNFIKYMDDEKYPDLLKN